MDTLRWVWDADLHGGDDDGVVHLGLHRHRDIKNEHMMKGNWQLVALARLEPEADGLMDEGIRRG
jgi:hypothetical protein